ncbi:Salicylate hydroxylase [Acrodontium crateriforme]|uniref:Salicylate hydroxylase n=1 Tax=Acrodontium crateriforme TaxID=150365 RepID=A0AAQ3M2Y4_9PEZI|nr:Salicylate hydroxylase [Acrodontium crateriforme]
MTLQNVAIIGGGLAGLSLSLFLNQRNIKTTIYELRSSNITSAGAIMLSPNALKSLDKIGAFDRIKSKGYFFRDVTFRNDEHEYLDAYEMGNADRFGYDALRIYRQVILDELRSMNGEAGVDIIHEKKFSHVVSENDNGVTFAFADGETCTADLLIGADGIHSTVRRYLVSGIKPAFSSVMAVTCAIPTKAVQVPYKPYEMPVSIHGQAGAFVMAPQNAEGSELLAGIQYRTHERTREAWDALFNDKQQLLDIMRADYDTWNPMVKSAIDAVPLDTLAIWPFHTVPKIEKWKSDKGRVIILGDSAHAIPPAAGQGVNQAFEDVHSLSILMGAANQGKVQWNESLDWWQEYRQNRIDRVTSLTNEMNRRRLPGWAGEGETIDSSWLFGVEIDKDVNAWIAEKK